MKRIAAVFFGPAEEIDRGCRCRPPGTLCERRSTLASLV